MTPPVAPAASFADLELDGVLRLSESEADQNRFPEHVLPARVALSRVRALRITDAAPRCNLASFVTTDIEPEAALVVEEARTVNEIDAEEYPSMDLMRNLALSWLADLWHAPPLAPGVLPVGADTVGSSEAIMLGVMAAKRRWRERRRAAGLPFDRPNIVLPVDAHVCWEKSANYFDLEAKWVPAHAGESLSRVEDLADAADENTVLIAAILGSTFTGRYYDVQKLDSLVGAKNAANPAWRLSIHVDGASGGFVAPFAQPELVWDFRLENVASINASGHKFGQALAGIGWVVFRTPDMLPASLIFADAYLGSAQTTLTLNFSKSACGLVHQMYMFMRLGRAGYTSIAHHMHRNAGLLREAILALGTFDVVSDPPPSGVPCVVFHLKDPPAAAADKGLKRAYNEFDIAERVKLSGFVVPAYPLAPNNESRVVLRVLTRQDFSGALRVALVHALKASVEWLEAHEAARGGGGAGASPGGGGGEAAAAAAALAAKEASALGAGHAALAVAAEHPGQHPAHVHAATLPARLMAAARAGISINRRGKC